MSASPIINEMTLAADRSANANSSARGSAADLRRYRRHKVDLRVKVTRFIDKQTLMGRGNDVSYGGMALYVAGEVTVGERLKLEFLLPYSRQNFVVESIVRNRAGFRIGVEFARLSQADRDELDKICRVIECTSREPI